MADQSNAGLFSGQQLNLDVESLNALLRVAQAQQQQECFVPSSQINNNFHTAPSDGNSSITATSSNSRIFLVTFLILGPIQECNISRFSGDIRKQQKIILIMKF